MSTSEPIEVYFPLSNRDEIVWRNGEISDMGNCTLCGSMVIRPYWLGHAEWHRELARED